MQDLHSLVHSLSSGEWLAFRNYLTCFTAHDTSKLKYLQLAEMLMNAEVSPTRDACCIAIYRTKNTHSFNELKSSLKEKILDFILTDISADKKTELDEADYEIIRIKKKSAQFQQLLYSKRRISLVYVLLEEIIKGAKEYEQFSMLVDHLRLKKALAGLKLGPKEFHKLSIEMDQALEALRIANKAEHYYYKLAMVGDFSSKFDKANIISELEKNIDEIKSGYRVAHSPIIHYYVKTLEMNLSELRQNFLAARSQSLEIINIVRNNKSVYRKQRIGVVYDNLSRYEFLLGDFHQAIASAREAQKNFNRNSENFCIALEQEFYAQFACDEYSKSLHIVGEMLASASRKELGEFRFSKYNILKANSLFMLREFQASLAILSEAREISSDKSGWEIGARILNIMTLIEMLKLEEASLAIMNLKQFFKRTDKKTPISKRDKTILNLLLVLERAGFLFGSLNGSTHKHLTALSSKEEELRWEPFTHEVIPFHEWFAGKMKMKTVRVIAPAKGVSKVKTSA